MIKWYFLIFGQNSKKYKFPIFKNGCKLRDWKI